MAINDAMSVMVEGIDTPMEKRLEKIGQLVIAIRQDMLNRTIAKSTKLSASDFKHINPGND